MNQNNNDSIISDVLEAYRMTSDTFFNYNLDLQELIIRHYLNNTEIKNEISDEIIDIKGKRKTLNTFRKKI